MAFTQHPLAVTFWWNGIASGLCKIKKTKQNTNPYPDLEQIQFYKLLKQELYHFKI